MHIFAGSLYSLSFLKKEKKLKKKKALSIFYSSWDPANYISRLPARCLLLFPMRVTRDNSEARGIQGPSGGRGVEATAEGGSQNLLQYQSRRRQRKGFES